MEIVAVLDYGMSNLRSVAKALEHVAGPDRRVEIASKPEQLLRADRVVFPGQGAIGQCMDNLLRLELHQVLRQCMETKPYLGICLGMQSLMDRSDEDGGTRCLGVVAGDVKRFPVEIRSESGRPFKIPHMGWSRVCQNLSHPLWRGIPDGERFYFVHSYYVKPDHSDLIAGTTDYITPFASAMARDNLFAVQFHPEKSQQCGLTLLENFLTWSP